jgi:hypothetical protein
VLSKLQEYKERCSAHTCEVIAGSRQAKLQARAQEVDSSRRHLRASGANQWQASSTIDKQNHVFVGGLLSLLIDKGMCKHHCCCAAVNNSCC